MAVARTVHVLNFGEIIAKGDMAAIQQNAACAKCISGSDDAEVDALVAGYGAVTVLHDISLSVGDREAVAIVGANGAGKTTWSAPSAACCVRARDAS